jgi:RNA recognition motif-containing protein
MKSNSFQSGRRGASQGGMGRSVRMADHAPYARNSNSGNKRIYVGNLAFSVDWKKLKDFFRSAGNVMFADVLTEGPSGRSKGCGIVEFEHAHEAANAIRAFNNRELDGRLMFIREDREERESPSEVHQSRVVSSFTGTRIYVGNLSWDVTWQNLKDCFSQVAPVVRADVISDATGRSKGCAIIDFQNPSDALRAINHLNNTELHGRPMFIREDREGSTAGAAFSAPASSGSNSDGNHRVYVGNLSWDVTWADLKDHFKPAGNVLRADILSEAGGRSKGCGIVEFGSAASAQNAIHSLNNTTLRGRPIFVREDRENNHGSGDGTNGADRNNGHQSVAVRQDGALATDRSAPAGQQPAHPNSTPGATKVFVGNLDWSVTWKELKDHFKPVGGVNHADVVVDGNGKSKGFGIVEMATPEDAQQAIYRLNNTILGSRQILVREDNKLDSNN